MLACLFAVLLVTCSSLAACIECPLLSVNLLLCRTRLRRLMVVEANRIFKLKRAILLLEQCALRLQRRWLKHRYPFGLPKYRHRRDEAALLFQVCERGVCVCLVWLST